MDLNAQAMASRQHIGRPVRCAKSRGRGVAVAASVCHAAPAVVLAAVWARQGGAAWYTAQQQLHIEKRTHGAGRMGSRAVDASKLVSGVRLERMFRHLAPATAPQHGSTVVAQDAAGKKKKKKKKAKAKNKILEFAERDAANASEAPRNKILEYADRDAANSSSTKPRNKILEYAEKSSGEKKKKNSILAFAEKDAKRSKKKNSILEFADKDLKKSKKKNSILEFAEKDARKSKKTNKILEYAAKAKSKKGSGKSKKGSRKTKEQQANEDPEEGGGTEQEEGGGEGDEDVAETARRNTAAQVEKARQTAIKSLNNSATAKKADPLLSKLKAASDTS